MTTERYQPWSLTPFEKWVKEEGLRVYSQQVVPDINAVELAPWERTGTNAAILDLTPEPWEGAVINTQGTTRYLCEIPPGGSFNAEKHMYEEIFYVMKGRGATTIWNQGEPKQTFEWQEGSVFSIPLNTWHEIFNGQGDETVRLYAATNAPTTFNLFASPELVFDCPMVFHDRYNPADEKYFSGRVNKLRDRFAETNFIADVHAVSLDRWVDRGPGANMMFSMAGGHFICHVSEFPVGSYKKGHTGEFTRSRGGLISNVAYLFLSGEGYDLQWPAGTKPGPDVEWERLDFGTGTLMSPGTGYHQHFNVGAEPARYLVLRYGNPRYSGSAGARYRETGGVQIEFEDEDSRIRELFFRELEKRGVESNMSELSAA